MAVREFDGELDAEPVSGEGFREFTGALDGDPPKAPGLADTLNKAGFFQASPRMNVAAPKTVADQEPQTKQRPNTAKEAGVAETLRQAVSGTSDAFMQGLGNLEQWTGDVLQAPLSSANELIHGARSAVTKQIAKNNPTAGYRKFVEDSTPGAADARARDSAESVADAARYAQEATANATAARKSNVASGNPVAVFGKDFQDVGKETSKHYQDQLAIDAPIMAQQMKNNEKATGFGGTLKSMLIDNPLGTLGTIGQSTPEMLFGMGAGKVSGVASSIVKSARAEALIADLAAGVKAGKIPAAEAAAQATALRTAAQEATEKFAGEIGMLAESASSVGNSKLSTEQFVNNQPHEKLAENSARYRELIAKGETPDNARASLAKELGNEAALLSGIGTFAGGKLVGADKALGSTLMGKKMTGKEFLQRTASETGQEGAQNPAENYAQYLSQVQADPTQKYDFGGSLAQGLASGLPIGAGMHGAGYLAQTLSAQAAAEPAPTQPAKASDDLASSAQDVSRLQDQIAMLRATSGIHLLGKSAPETDLITPNAPVEPVTPSSKLSEQREREVAKADAQVAFAIREAFNGDDAVTFALNKAEAENATLADREAAAQAVQEAFARNPEVKNNAFAILEQLRNQEADNGNQAAETIPQQKEQQAAPAAATVTPEAPAALSSEQRIAIAQAAKEANPEAHRAIMENPNITDKIYELQKVLETAPVISSPPATKSAITSNVPLNQRGDGLVATILRITGGKGIAESSLLDITSDTRKSKVAGLFTKQGKADLSDPHLMEGLNDAGYLVRSGEDVSNLIRSLANGEKPASVDSMIADADKAEKAKYRNYILEQAEAHKLKGIGANRSFSAVETEVHKLLNAKQARQEAAQARQEAAQARQEAEQEATASAAYGAEVESSKGILSDDDVSAIVSMVFDQNDHLPLRQKYTLAKEKLREATNAGRNRGSSSEPKSAGRNRANDGQIADDYEIPFSKPRDALYSEEETEDLANQSSAAPETVKPKAAQQQANANAPSHREGSRERTIQDALTTDEGGAPAITIHSGLKPAGNISAATFKALNQVARIFKQKVVYFSSDRRTPDGFILNGTIYLNVNSTVSPLALLGHEITHRLQKEMPNAWTAVAATLAKRMGKAKLIAMYRSYHADESIGKTDEQIVKELNKDGALDHLMGEMVSDFAGNQFTDAKFWGDVFGEIIAVHPEGVAKRLIERLRLAVMKMVGMMNAAIKQPGFNKAWLKGETDAKAADEWLNEVNGALKTAYAKWIIRINEQGYQQAQGDAQAQFAASPFRDLFDDMPESERQAIHEATQRNNPTPDLFSQPAFKLAGQTNKEAAAEHAQKPSDKITKEQADKERDAVPFSLEKESQPKPVGVQGGLFEQAETAKESTAISKNPQKSVENAPKQYKQGDLIGADAKEIASLESSLEEKRRQLVDLENKIVGMAGLAPGFVEDALRSRKVPANLKNDRKALRDELVNLRGQIALIKESAPKQEEIKPSGKIDDFGEKLGGAKKDIARSQKAALAREFSDEELGAQPLSVIWPKQDVEAIENPFVAAFAHTARAEIPSKPRKWHKLTRWIGQVKALRNMTSHILNLPEEKVRALTLEHHAITKSFVPKVNLLMAIDRSAWARIGKVSEHPTAYRYGENSEQIPAPFVMVEVDDKRHSFNGVKSVSEVVEKVNELLGTEAKVKKMQFEVRGREGAYSINKKGDSEYRKLKTFPTAKEAFEFINNSYDELVSEWDGVKARDNVKEDDVRNETNRDRTAQDWRKGKDVTPEQFDEAFGFRGTEFGNWVSQGKNGKERQGMLNQAYDAFMDLADIIGIPPKAVSLNGSLGIGFGSRGSGKASAHCEPGAVIINLTKTRGAGTLAHEWFHALDNYFSRMRGGESKFTGDNADYRKNNYITYKPEPMYVHKTKISGAITKAELERMHQQHPSAKYLDPSQWHLDPNHPQGVRPEVERAFAKLVETLNDSPMAARSARNDKGADGYWSRIIERGARSFENYVISKMMRDGYHNDYLANVRAAEDFPRDQGRYPYLLQAEIAPVSEAFDKLFSTVETKKTEIGVAMFSPARYAEEVADVPQQSFDALGDFWLNMAGHKDLYYFPTTKSTGMSEAFLQVARAKDPNLSIKVLEASKPGENADGMDLTKSIPGGKSWAIFHAESNDKDVPVGLIHEKNGKVWIDVSAMSSGKGGGAGVYSAVGQYARNAGKEFIGDPKGFTGDANARLGEIRRVEHLISQALRYGNTDHISLGDKHPLNSQWKAKDFRHNLDLLLKASYANYKWLFEAQPELGEVTFDVKSEQFIDPFGDVVTDGRFEELLGFKSGGISSKSGLRGSTIGERIGVATAKRAVVSRSILEGMGEREAGRLLADIDAKLDSVELGRESSLRGVQYSTPRLNEVSNEPSIHRAIDGQELTALRRAAVDLERTKDGIFLRVTEDGKAIATGQKGQRIPDTFRRFAHDNDLAFYAERRIPRAPDANKGEGYSASTMPRSLTSKSEAMPIAYRESGAVYFGESTGEALDRTSKARFSTPRFVSQLATQIDTVPARLATQPAAQWKLWLSSNAAKLGIKKDEIEWSGINDYLAMRGKEKVSKDEIGAFLSENGTQVNDVVLGGMPKEGINAVRDQYAKILEQVVDSKDDAAKMANAIADWASDYDARDERAPSQIVADKDRGYELLREAIDNGEIDGNEIHDAVDVAKSEKKDTNFSQYVVPGGTNYRELLITLPASEEQQRNYKNGLISRSEFNEGKFFSSHWPETPNILAHLRFDERTDAEGNPTLFIQEIQSDWSAEGKNKGFSGGMHKSGDMFAVIRNGEFVQVTAYHDTFPNGVTPVENASGDRFSVTLNEGVPSGPFVTDTKSYVALALKKSIMYAVQHGMTRVAWANGEQNADHYDLSKQITSIEYEDQGDGTYHVIAIDKQGNSHLGDKYTAAQLEDTVGKEVAQKITNGEGPMVKGSGVWRQYHELSGLDLKVGSGGMRVFYDQIVPQVANDVLKKLGGGKVESLQPESIGAEKGKNGEDYSGMLLGAITITPAMQAKVSEGVPLFSLPRSALTNQPINEAWTTDGTVPQLDSFVRSMQDKLIDTKRIIAEIRKAGVAIKDSIDPYLQEVLFHGRSAKRVSDFADNELRPMLVEMSMRQIDRQTLEDYLWARHAEERNAQIAKVNPKMPDGGSGLTSQQAKDILAGKAVTIDGRTIQLDTAKMSGYQSLAKKLDAIREETLDTLVRYGLESQATVDTWRKTYANYVPLMRDMESDDNYAGAFNLGLGTGQGFSVKGSASKRAMGSERGVIDILANVAMQRERAIVRGEKNRVSQAMYGLALAAPNPEFWLPLNPDSNKDPKAVVAELVKLGLNPVDAENIAKEPKQQYIDPRTGMVMERINPQLRNRGDVLALRVDGKDRYVMFSSNERAQQMVRGLKNLDVENLGLVMQKMAVVTRWFASINTQFNPVFGLTNGIRDLGTGMLNLSSTELKGHQKEVFKNAFSALRGIYSDLRDHRAGRTPSSAWALEFEEFANEGGQTGYRDMFQTSQARSEALMKELENASKGKTMLTLSEKRSPLFGWLSDYNTAIENAVRLAAYKAAKDKGMSKQQAANLAKNLTVNFNKKGLAATQLGAMYAFFNAAVQGTARIGTTMVTEENGKRSLSAAGKKILYGGMMAGVLQAVMMAAAEYDDEEPPQYIREKNFIIPLPGGKYLSIPYPLGFHVIPNIGRVATEFALGGFKNPGKRLVSMLSMMTDAFNPVGNSSSGFSQMISPTAADPFVALSENKDWTGKPIYKEDFNKMHPTAGHTRTKDNASFIGRWLSYGTNYITGGGKYEIGLLSPTPDQIDYLISQATGGVGREALKAGQSIDSAITGEDMPMYKVPVVGRFVGETTGQASETSKFYNNLKRIGKHKSALDEMKDAGDVKAMMAYRRDNPDAMLVKQADAAMSDVNKLKRRKRELLEKGASKEQIKLIDMQITARVKRYNQVLSDESRNNRSEMSTPISRM